MLVLKCLILGSQTHEPSNYRRDDLSNLPGTKSTDWTVKSFIKTYIYIYICVCIYVYIRTDIHTCIYVITEHIENKIPSSLQSLQEKSNGLLSIKVPPSLTMR